MEKIKNNILVNTLRATRSAIDLRIKAKERGEFGYKLYSFEKVILALRTLYPTELRLWINLSSSYTYGAHIFDQTFPQSENPDPFHSTPESVDLSDNPQQVLGWKEVEALKKEGVSQGLNYGWIDLGFEMSAQERGIDLEWHFYSVPRQKIQKSDSNQLTDGNRS